LAAASSPVIETATQSSTLIWHCRVSHAVIPLNGSEVNANLARFVTAKRARRCRHIDNVKLQTIEEENQKFADFVLRNKLKAGMLKK
jgi:hypothetical protein